MNQRHEDAVAIVEELAVGQALDVSELCRVCELSQELLIEWVAEGVTEPRSSRSGEWRFGPRQLKRVRKARRLQADLGLETTALPLVLDLLDEVEQLRRRVRLLERLVD
ncbi:MAG: MerR family transcriptional regulator [Wenzhouxiangella sp.]|nr:MerR family transcriptional regulator [Wenzhouxiangella sp.]MCH8477379.1 chaperone modulator CbpM [Wenzhouxiangella sp.]TVR97965.1 MAG: MerR family transcriptional regulator [Wenzhouxiangellaceae bacterium]